MVNPIVWLILKLLDLYIWVIIISVVVSWLLVFGVINVYNPIANSVVRALNALTEPVFDLVRRVIPPIGGLDLAPLVVLFAIYFLQYAIQWAYVRFFLYGVM